jgi:hypothetical protein
MPGDAAQPKLTEYALSEVENNEVLAFPSLGMMWRYPNVDSNSTGSALSARVMQVWCARAHLEHGEGESWGHLPKIGLLGNLCKVVVSIGHDWNSVLSIRYTPAWKNPGHILCC